MLGLQIDQRNIATWPANFSVILVVLSIVLGLWIGPTGILYASGLGLIVGLWAYWKARSRFFPLVPSALHLILIVVAFVLYALFLKPLTKEIQRIPPLKYEYKDPDRLFSLRGPKGWTYENLGSALEAGVRIRPATQDQYMGISELLIYIRKLESRPKSPQEFLKKMAVQWVGKKEKKSTLFDFSVTPADLIDGKKGLWSTLDAKRFWVPVRQVTLMGVKNDLYLCSISAIGLKNHATLSQVFCLGLYETLKINPDEK